MALAGFELTNDFGDPASEARACRTDCALFDFSFLECARLQGPRACSIIETFAGRSLQALAEKQIFYALRVDAGGAMVADLTIWRTGAQTFDVMSGRREDVAALLDCAGPGSGVPDMTAGRATFAAQGPGTLDALRNLGDVGAIRRLEYFTFGHADLADIPCTVGRLGYTGEAGFEVIGARARGLVGAGSAPVSAAGRFLGGRDARHRGGLRPVRQGARFAGGSRRSRTRQ